MLGSHLGGPVAHTTGRTHRLELRAATALLGHLGIEWDLTGIDDAARESVRAWVSLHKQARPLLATGRLVHGDHPDPAVQVTGAVARDAAEAWYVVAVTAMPATQHLGAVRLPGLDPSRRYRLEDVTPTEGQHGLDLRPTRAVWSGTRQPGAVLGEVGVRLGPMAPDTARVLRVVAE
jgi:alpha-galactosidase